jgi:hypothetical protein
MLKAAILREEDNSVLLIRVEIRRERARRGADGCWSGRFSIPTNRLTALMGPTIRLQFDDGRSVPATVTEAGQSLCSFSGAGHAAAAIATSKSASGSWPVAGSDRPHLEAGRHFRNASLPSQTRSGLTHDWLPVSGMARSSDLSRKQCSRTATRHAASDSLLSRWRLLTRRGAPTIEPWNLAEKCKL